MSPYSNPLYGHMTTAQIRDMTTLPQAAATREKHAVRDALAEFRVEKERREKSTDYVQCPRCREHHSDKTTYEGICHRCRLILLDHFPNHQFTREMEKFEGFLRA